MKLLAGKTALVTGGSRGIGEAIARAFAAQGANVAFTYLSSEERALAIVADLESMGVKAKCYKSDASDFQQAEQLTEAVLADFGRIDIPINNAGITRDTLMLRMSEEQWDEVIRVNLKSVFNLTKHTLKVMLKQKSGSIVNMGSVVGYLAMPDRPIMRHPKQAS